MSSLSDFLPPASETWGPSKIDYTHTFVPVEFVGRTEKLGRFCDFTVGGMRARRGDQGGADEFQFVDTRPINSRTKKFAPRAANQYQQGGRGKGKGGSFFVRGGRGGQWGAPRIDHRTGKPVVTKAGSMAKPAQRPHWQRGASNIVKGIRDWSVAIKPEYSLVTELSLASLGRRKLDASKSEWLIADAGKIQFEDLIKCGQLSMYDKSFDKIPARQPKALAKFENTNFYNVSTGQDPVLEELITRAVSEEMAPNSVLVACTDQVLAFLMAANRSVYSWDLVITRNGNTILIDKRDGASSIDFLTVSENAQDPPSFDENIDPLQQINSPVKLGVEATGLCQNFSQQVLVAGEAEAMPFPNPFYDEEEDESTVPASTAYVYRKAFVPLAASSTKSTSPPREYNFIIRGEVNAKTETGKYVSVKALHEYDPKITNWRESFERNRETAVFATEMKNNGFKIAKWLASSVVSDVEVPKLGFLARKQDEDPWNHQILAVQTHNVLDLMAQMSISTQSLWSSVCSIVDQIMTLDPVGRYLVVKDPAKPALNMYSIPWDEFEGEMEEDDDEEGDEDGEDGDEEDGQFADE